MMKLTRFKLALLLYVAFDFLIGGHCGGLLPLGEVMAAQSGPPAIGNITSAGSTCSTTSTPTNCVILQLDAASGAATIEITGTFVGTGQFEAFSGSAWTNINCTPPNSTTAASSATAAGAWQCNVAGYSAIRVRASAYVSGTLVVIINSAHASAKSSGGGAVYASGNGTNNVVPKGTGANQLADSTLVDNGAGAITIPGSITNQGGTTLSALGAPANATLVVTGGVGTNYTYKLVALAGSTVVHTAANSGVSTAVGPTTLDGTHFNDINFVSQIGCTSIDVYRTVGGAAQGKIGNVACTTAGAALTLRDNALVGDASTAPATDTTGSLTYSGQIFAPAGSSSLPPYSFAAGPANGVFLSSNRVALIASNGAQGWIQIEPNAGGAWSPSTATIGWDSSTTLFGGSHDTGLRRRTTASIFLGAAADVNGVPVAQTLGVQNAITGTDLAGSKWTLEAPLGTGAGAGASTVINRAQILATGTTAQTGANAFVVCETKILSNTSATTTTIATVGLASNSGGGVTVFHSLTATDATNFDEETQSYNVSFVNKAGVITVGTPAITTSTAANNSGTATIGATVTGASPTISLKVTPVYGTIVPSTVTLYTTIINHGAGAVTCQ